MLNQEERDHLQNFIDQSSPGTPYLRRAQITLYHDQGIEQDQIARDLDFPPARVRQWLRVLNRQGMGAFPDQVLLHDPPFTSNDTLIDAGLVIFRTLLSRLFVLELELESTLSVKSVHETRKAIRRLRTALILFESAYDLKEFKRYRKRFRKIMRRLSRLRDHDVFLIKLERYMSEELDWGALKNEEALSFRQLENHWRERKNRVDKKAKSYLDKGKYRALLMDFGSFLTALEETEPGSQPYITVGGIAPDLIAAGAQGVHDIRVEAGEMSLEQLHTLRIELKELRYTLEFFRPVLGPTATSIIEVLKTLLTHLGDLNDARVHIIMLGQDQADAPTAAAAAYLAKIEGDLKRLRAEFPSMWARFDQEEWRKGLADAVAGN